MRNEDTKPNKTVLAQEITKVTACSVQALQNIVLARIQESRITILFPRGLDSMKFLPYFPTVLLMYSGEYDIFRLGNIYINSLFFQSILLLDILKILII